MPAPLHRLTPLHRLRPLHRLAPLHRLKAALPGAALFGAALLGAASHAGAVALLALPLLAAARPAAAQAGGCKLSMRFRLARSNGSYGAIHGASMAPASRTSSTSADEIATGECRNP